MEKILPRDYNPLLTRKETQNAIFQLRRYIEDSLCKELKLMMVQVPLIVDAEARQVERWRPGAASPEIVTRALSWQPVASVPPLNIDLESLFRIVWTGLENGPA